MGGGRRPCLRDHIRKEGKFFILGRGQALVAGTRSSSEIGESTKKQQSLTTSTESTRRAYRLQLRKESPPYPPPRREQRLQRLHKTYNAKWRICCLPSGGGQTSWCINVWWAPKLSQAVHLPSGLRNNLQRNTLLSRFRRRKRGKTIDAGRKTRCRSKEKCCTVRREPCRRGNGGNQGSFSRKSAHMASANGVPFGPPGQNGYFPRRRGGNFHQSKNK